MNPTRKYLEHYAQVNADTVTGVIVERMPDGTYLYEDVATGAKRYATANLRDEFTIGSRVRIDRVSASRGVIGSQDTILTRAPREQRGLSATTPAVDRQGVDRTVIMSVSPDPLVIYAGGDPGTQTFEGVGFDSQAATYVSSYEGGPSPELTDEDPPVTSDTSCVMNISAASDAARGDFDAIINGARAPKALRILNPLPFSPTYGFFVVADSTTNELVLVAYIAGSPPWSTIEHVIWKRSTPLGGTVLRIAQIANGEYLVFFAGGGARRVTISSAGAFTFSAIGNHPEPWSPYAQFAVNGGNIYYGTAANSYVEVNIVTGAVVRTLLAASSVPYRGSLYHGATDSFYTANSLDVGGDIKIHKIDRVTGSDTTARLSFSPASPDAVTSEGDSLFWVMSDYLTANKTKIRKILASTLGSTATSDDLTTAMRGNGHLWVANGRVRAPLRSIATGASGKRPLVSVVTGLTGGQEENAGSGFEGVGAVLVPADEGPWGSDPFVWRIMDVTSGTPAIVIRGKDARAGNSVEQIELQIPSTDLPPASAGLGLGWTAI